MNWKRKAACRGYYDVVFGDDARATVPKAYCDHCPVRAECEAEGVEVMKTVTGTLINGVWGGLTDAQMIAKYGDVKPQTREFSMNPEAVRRRELRNALANDPDAPRCATEDCDKPAEGLLCTACGARMRRRLLAVTGGVGA